MVRLLLAADEAARPAERADACSLPKREVRTSAREDIVMPDFFPMRIRIQPEVTAWKMALPTSLASSLRVFSCAATGDKMLPRVLLLGGARGCAGRAWAQTLRATWASFSRRNIATRASAESTPAAHAFRYLSSASSLSFDGGGGGGGIEAVGSTRGWSTAVPSVRRAANRGAWLRTVKETLPARDAKSSSSMR